MSDYIPKGGAYDWEEDPEAREDLETSGLVARCQTWPEVPIAAREYLKLQAEGLLGGSARHYKLRIWKSKVLQDFPWCIKWVEKTPKEEVWSARVDAP